MQTRDRRALRAVFTRDGEGWHASVVDVPGCRTWGPTLDAARLALREALSTCEDVFDDPDAVAASAVFVEEVVDREGVVQFEDGNVVFTVDGRLERRRPAISATKLDDAYIEYFNARFASDHVRMLDLLERQWIATFASATDVVLAAGGCASWMVEGAFWTRLWGVICDLRHHYEDLARPLIEFGMTAESARKLRHKSAPVFDRLEATTSLLRLFDRDELIFIDYLRQTSCHPFQRGYGPEWYGKDWRPKNDYQPRTVGEAVLKSDCASAIRRVHAKWSSGGGPNESLVAYDFAARVAPQVPALLAVFAVDA